MGYGKTHTHLAASSQHSHGGELEALLEGSSDARWLKKEMPILYGAMIQGAYALTYDQLGEQRKLSGKLIRGMKKPPKDPQFFDAEARKRAIRIHTLAIETAETEKDRRDAKVVPATHAVGKRQQNAKAKKKT